MLFEKEKYYNYINKLEKNITITYIIITIFTAIIGTAILQGIGFIIGILLGLLISGNHTLITKIKVQKMKWELDIYDKIKEN